MSFNRSAQNVQLTGGNLIIVDIDKKIRSSKYEFANGGSDGAGTSVNLQDVTEQGASTDRTVTFSNVTTAFTTTSNVGIGTTSLTSRLTVQGAAAAPGVLSALRLRNSSDGGIGLHFDNNVCNLANIEARVTSTGAGTDNGILSFSTSNDAVIAERMRITSDGNISIGTASSYGKLSVLGNNSTVLDSFNIGSATSNGVVSTIYNTNETVGSYAGIRLMTRNSGASHWGIFNKSTGGSTGNLVFCHGSGTSGSEHMTITSGGVVITPCNLGKNYPQTSGSGTGTSIVDTGITYDTGDFDGYGRGATYQVVFNGNPNGGGSGAYFAQYTGFIIVHTGYDYGVSAVTTYIGYTQLASGNINIGPLTLTARFWNGSSETTSIGVFTGGAQIRIKIAGYNSAYTGLDQSVYLTRIA